jgi:branched-chain amino acid transport system ATP-binding protein
MADILLQAKDISKRFGGVQALTDVNFTINKGEIYGLIGPNGAGKTTLFNVLTSIYTPDTGVFTFDGQPLVGFKKWCKQALRVLSKTSGSSVRFLRWKT